MRYFFANKDSQMRKTCRIFCIVLLLCWINTQDNGICEMNYETRLWYKYAIAYINYDEMIAKGNVKDNESALEILGQREQAKTKLLSVSAPTDAELELLLRSSRILDQKIALVNIMLRDVYTEHIYNNIIDILNSSNDFFLRFYCYHCINLLDDKRLNRFGNDFIAILKHEKVEGLITTAMPTLVKIKSDEVVCLYVRYFKQESRTLKWVAYIYFDKLDREYQKKIKTILEKENAWPSRSELIQE